MMIDIKKEYTTRSGLPVRIYAVDGGGKEPVHGAFFEDGEWHVTTWNEKGQYQDTVNGYYDLIEKKKVTEVGIGVFMDQGVFWCATFHNETYFKTYCTQLGYTEIEFFTKQYEI
jgi:hypothetical protein